MSAPVLNLISGQTLDTKAKGNTNSLAASNNTDLSDNYLTWSSVNENPGDSQTFNEFYKSFSQSRQEISRQDSIKGNYLPLLKLETSSSNQHLSSESVENQLAKEFDTNIDVKTSELFAELAEQRQRSDIALTSGNHELLDSPLKGDVLTKIEQATSNNTPALVDSALTNKSNMSDVDQMKNLESNSPIKSRAALFDKIPDRVNSGSVKQQPVNPETSAKVVASTKFDTHAKDNLVSNLITETSAEEEINLSQPSKASPLSVNRISSEVYAKNLNLPGANPEIDEFTKSNIITSKSMDKPADTLIESTKNSLLSKTNASSNSLLMQVNENQRASIDVLTTDNQTSRSGFEISQNQLASQVSSNNLDHLTSNSNIQQGLSLKKGFSPNLAHRIQWIYQQALNSAEILMDPPELGPLSVKLNNSNGETNIVFQVTNAQTKEMIEDNLSKLKDLLAEQGIDLGDTQVEHQQQSETDQEASSQKILSDSDNDEENQEAVIEQVQVGLLDTYI